MPEKTLLQKYGEFAAKHPETILSVAIIITLFMGLNAVKIDVETDFYKSLPQDLPALENQNFLAEVFSETDNIFILVELNTEKSFESKITDIRNSEVMKDLNLMEELLRKDPNVNEVFGPPDILLLRTGGIPENQEDIKNIFNGDSGLFSSDYSTTIVTVRLNGKIELEEIEEVVEEIENEVESIGFPGSVSLSVTGGPLIGKIVSDLIFDDLYKTLAIAGVLIFLTLMISYRSILRGIFSISILFLAFIWTAGTMVIIGVPLSIVTVVVGSLIVGIGIDYAIHIINRYNEERSRRRDDSRKICIEGDYDGCMKTCFICYGVAVDRVGRAIVGTAITTIASFLALTLSGIPFLSDMGIALSLGIFYAMILSIFFLPSLLSIRDWLHVFLKDEIKRQLK